MSLTVLSKIFRILSFQQTWNRFGWVSSGILTTVGGGPSIWRPSVADRFYGLRPRVPNGWFEARQLTPDWSRWSPQQDSWILVPHWKMGHCSYPFVKMMTFWLSWPGHPLEMDLNIYLLLRGSIDAIFEHLNRIASWCAETGIMENMNRMNLEFYPFSLNVLAGCEGMAWRAAFSIVQ